MSDKTYYYTTEELEILEPIETTEGKSDLGTVASVKHFRIYVDVDGVNNRGYTYKHTDLSDSYEEFKEECISNAQKRIKKEFNANLEEKKSSEKAKGKK